MTAATNGKPPGVGRAQGLMENNFKQEAIMPSKESTAPRFSPREARALQALAASTGWVGRETMDRIAGASNSPDIIMRLRRKLGQDAIDRRHVDATDRDGRPCRPGQYRLTDQGRQRLAQVRAEVAP